MFQAAFPQGRLFCMCMKYHNFPFLGPSHSLTPS